MPSTVSQQQKARFFAEGHTLPTCVNDGCNNNVQVREWKYWSFKSECSSCASARKKGINRPGITRHKKDYCENIGLKFILLSIDQLIIYFFNKYFIHATLLLKGSAKLTHSLTLDTLFNQKNPKRSIVTLR